MLLATIVLLGAGAVPVPTPQSGNASKDVEAVELPSMPVPKADIESEAAAGADTKVSANAAVEPAIVATPVRPIRGSFTRPRETRTQRVAWYGLAAVSSGAAAFDAYSTRRALSGNYGVEGNPLLRPFAHSNALYAATQVSPAVLDYIGKRMMVSENPTLRKFWWLPQMAGSGFSVFAGVHNMGVVK